MPVYLDSHSSESRSASCISIGLVNNMADEALKATERQYISLLASASPGMRVHLSLYTLPGIPRGQASARHIAARYACIDDLWEGRLDGLIVTGREPLAPRLTDEPYWESFTRTVAWAQENAHATVWSCLAAHAAVLSMDGLNRAPRKQKLFGIFPCTALLNHPLMGGISTPIRLPHSRWNGLSEDQLAGAGYSVLTRTDDGEVDTFIKQQKKLFVFFQGHPEYEADTLLREYRRDILRYFQAETSTYPRMPSNYFDSEATALLNALEQQSHSVQDGEMVHAISAALSGIQIQHTWRSSATGIYQNWLSHICAQKNRAARSVSRRPIANALSVRSADSPLAAPVEV